MSRPSPTCQGGCCRHERPAHGHGPNPKLVRAQQQFMQSPGQGQGSAVDPFVHDKDRLQGLRALAVRSNVAEFEALLRANQLPISGTVDGTTLLHTAAEFGMLGHVKALISHGADVNVLDVRGVTPLHLAVQFGHEQVVEELVASGADIERAVKTETALPGGAVLTKLLGLERPTRAVDLAKTVAQDEQADEHTRAAALRIHDKLDRISCSGSSSSSSSSSAPSTLAKEMCSVDTCTIS